MHSREFDVSFVLITVLACVLLTTSSFSKHAQEYIATIDSRIVLIDGPTLAQLMVDHNVGVTAIASYEIKKINSDYFTES